MFLSDPNSIVAAGIAYHPQYYQSDSFFPGAPSFETMVLGKQNVIVNNMIGVTPVDYFSDGSEVILVGCKIADDNLWGAKRTIMRTYALFQLDHEKNSYIAGINLPYCSNKE
jgi:hypothetical protein